MIDSTFDTVARQAAARISRRGSLLALGSASLAALAGTVSVGAKKKKRNSKRRNKRLANRKCRRQVEPCQTTLAQLNFPELAFCCEFLDDCGVTEFLDCIIAA